MGEGLDFSCESGRCTWNWDPTRYPVDEISLRVRQRDGGTEVRKVPNTGSIVYPEEEEVLEIVTAPEGEGRRRRPR